MSKPKFYGLTVTEHLHYIKELQDTFETRYILVERLKEKVNSEISTSISEFYKTLKELVEMCEIDFESYKEIILQQSKQSYAGYMIKDILNTVIREFFPNPSENIFIPKDHPLYPLQQRVNSLRNKNCRPTPEDYHKWDDVRKKYNELIGNTLFIDFNITDEIEFFKSHLKNLSKQFPKMDQFFLNINHSIDSMVNDITKENDDNDRYHLYETIRGLMNNTKIAEEHEDTVLYLSNLKKRIPEYKSFIELLDNNTVNLKNLAEIYVDNILDSMKINWIGSITDCSTLIKFLKDNGYIEIKYKNKFIADHFRFNNKNTTPRKIERLHLERDGVFLDMGTYLKIPRK
ncbi:MAG: hypothetical protein K9K78_07365 [Spirochaetales bacterium]|nr:hypothetical protein [Spirochaetales bacterium]